MHSIVNTVASHFSDKQVIYLFVIISDTPLKQMFQF